MSRKAISTRWGAPVIVSVVVVYAILDLRSSLDHPLRDAVETLLKVPYWLAVVFVPMVESCPIGPGVCGG